MRSPDDLRAVAEASAAGLGELAAPTGADAAPEAGVVEAPTRSQWALIWRRFLKHRLAVASGLLLIVMALLVIFADQVSPYDFDAPLTPEILSQQLQPPSARHWFGTDELGRDQLTRIIHAGRVSLFTGLAVALAAMLFGTAMGALAGFFGGWIDQVLMRLTDLVLVLPVLAVLLIASKALGHTMQATIIVLAALLWMPVARVVRGLFLSLKRTEFAEAAIASGAPGRWVIVRHLLPNAVGPILVDTTLNVGQAILTESTLSFLGFGIQPPQVSWGNMLAQSTSAVGTSNAYLIWFPGLAILFTVLCVNFLGDGLRDALDPTSRH
jgi:peptide/nickel transport system permease protein